MGRRAKGALERKKRPVILKILDIFVMAIALALCITSLVCVVSYILSGADHSVFGIQLRVVLSTSMEGEESFYEAHDYAIEALPKDTIVFVGSVPDETDKRAAWYGSLQEGDVLVFEYDWPDRGRIVLMHRIIGIDRRDGETVIRLKGDHPKSEGQVQEIRSTDDAVLGKVNGQSRALGAMMLPLRQGWGYLVLALVAAAVYIPEIMRLADKTDERAKLLGRYK